MKRIFLVGTADTKGEELSYLYDFFKGGDFDVARVDVGTTTSDESFEFPSEQVAANHPDGRDSVMGKQDRGIAVAAMTVAFEQFCQHHAKEISGIIGLGGGGGTSIVAAGMRQLGYGVPKVLISTLASGDVSPYVDISDIAMFPSVTDIAGLNRLSRIILNNAAHALLGMVDAPEVAWVDDKPAIGLSMFGVTTPSVMAISAALRDRFDCLVFHATGTGGRAMEKLASDGILSGLIDITTTEVCDLLLGGVLPAGADRLDVVARLKLPYVGSVGALDMVNFWGPSSVPEALKTRNLYFHNSNVTLMRTTPEECTRIGVWIGEKLNACDGPVRFLLPEKGVSSLDIEGGPFLDPAANAALFAALNDTIKQTENRQLVSLPYHINDPEFSTAATNAFLEIQQD